MLELLYTSTAQLRDKNNYFFSDNVTALFRRDWDCIFVLAGYDIYKIFRDGTIIRVGQMGSNSAYGGLAYGKLFYTNYFGNDVVNVCEFTSQPIYTSVIAQRPGPSPLGIWTGDFIDVELGYVFHRGNYNGRIIDIFDINNNNSYVRSIDLVQNNYPWFYQYGGRNRLVCTNVSGGWVVIYDYSSWSVVQQSQLGITGNKFITYDSKYDVILALGSDNYLKIFSMEDLGNSISAPTFTPTGNIYTYSGYLLKTRVLGSASTPIAGKIVNWELSNNVGNLEKNKSVTDINGYATNYYYAPQSLVTFQPPGVAPVVELLNLWGNITYGSHKVKVTWFNNNIGEESQLSPESQALTAYAGHSEIKVYIPNEEIPGGITHWKIYMNTIAAPTVYKFVAQVAIGTTNYTINKSDAQLGGKWMASGRETVTVTCDT